MSALEIILVAVGGFALGVVTIVLLYRWAIRAAIGGGLGW